jgi:hypothetical protein
LNAQTISSTSQLRNVQLTSLYLSSVAIFITSKEERFMGISADETIAWGEGQGFPDTDGLQEMEERMKRNRSESNIDVQPPNKIIRSH